MPKWAIIIRIYYYELKRSKFYYLCFIYPTSYIYIPLLSVLKHLNDNFTFWAKDFSLKKCYAAQIFIHFVRYFELEIFFYTNNGYDQICLTTWYEPTVSLQIKSNPFFSDQITIELNWFRIKKLQLNTIKYIRRDNFYETFGKLQYQISIRRKFLWSIWH